MKRLMIMESDPKLLDILCFAIGREGYDIVPIRDGLDGISFLEQQAVDLIILDLTGPMDSIATCRCLREEGIRIPILVLAGEKQCIDLRAFDNTDYVLKPFPMPELLLKIKQKTINARGHLSRLPIPAKEKTLGRFVIDPYKSIIFKDGVPLDLTQRDYDLLIYLFGSPGKIFTREELLHQVWDYPGYIGDVRGVDVAVRRLRTKIEDDPAHPVFLVTKRGQGYLFGV